MNRITASICALLFVSQATYAGTTVDAKTFFQSIQSSYEITLAGGEAAHEGNTLADVFADTDVALFTTPYCWSGGCWQGYLDMPYAQTTVDQETLTDGSVQSTLTVNNGTQVLTYVWTDKGSEIVFRNPQYILEDGVTVLEHVLAKPIAAPVHPIFTE